MHGLHNFIQHQTYSISFICHVLFHPHLFTETLLHSNFLHLQHTFVFHTFPVGFLFHPAIFLSDSSLTTLFLGFLFLLTSLFLSHTFPWPVFVSLHYSCLISKLIIKVSFTDIRETLCRKLSLWGMMGEEEEIGRRNTILLHLPCWKIFGAETIWYKS